MKLRVALALWLYALAATPAAAQVKVSDLPAASTLAGTEVMPGVQSSTSKKISVAQIGTYVATNPTIISAVQAGIPDATTSVSGLESAADKTKLNGIATGATVNSTDAQLRDRSTHTGTQSADTLTDGTTNKAFLATERTKLAGIATAATANSSDATLLNRTNHTGTQSADTLTDGTTNKAFLATERTKLTGIATGATANSADATLLNRTNHTGTQSADTLTDGTTNKAFLATERTKLTGIATGATANSADATLLNRANHTGTQANTTITGLGTMSTQNASGISLTGAITSTLGSAVPALDTSGTTVSMVNGATLDFTAFSGMIMITDLLSGNVGLFLVGGGAVATIANTLGATGTLLLTSGVYRYTNTTGATRSINFTAIRSKTTG